jgi:hypothetical protein
MSKGRLLDRQSNLLEYLTSGAAIFGQGRVALLDASLHGVDLALLQLEARFSHQKRMEKIAAVFPKTFAILGESLAQIVQEFAETCPPVDINRLANANQFHDFLSLSRQHDPGSPYLRDVTACELAFLKVRVAAEERQTERKSGKKTRSHRMIRRRPGVALLRCAYDIRGIFEESCDATATATAPKKRDTPLALAIPLGADRPHVFEVLPIVFDLLVALDDWTDLVAVGKIPEIEGLIADLLGHGLIEVRR